ncbi:MAG: type IX secretion system membrane protein PorP/SprF [Bacteroidota bacterium]
MKTKFIGLVLVLLSGVGYAQQDAQYTQYMYNTIAVNPAYAGSRETLSVFGLYRTQWVGLEGAPQTANFSVNTPIGKNLGLGVSIVSDKIGPQNENNFSIDFSYSVPLSESYKLSFGIKGSGSLLNVDYTKLSYPDPTDPIFQQNIDNKFLPNIGAGIYLHSDKGYIGVSAPYIIENEHYDKNTTFIATERIHYYGIAGYVFDLSPSLQFKPSVLTKVVEGAPLQVDLSGNFLINQKFTAGLAYRWDAAYSALVGFQASQSWFIGYAYDRDSTKFADYNSGSHEIFLRYELFTKPNRVISPRFF